ncbi:MAG: hypothetical protein LBI04_11235 [Treponema sp.]|nr:hypothetical protein [Treponema sp.]
MALTFGINTLGALKPFVKVGYGFGATETKADPDGKNEATRDDGGKFLLQAGMNYELNETQAIYADLTLGMDFAGSYSGKAKDQFGAASDKQEIGDSYMGIVLYTHFDQTVNADKITVKFNPNISVAYLGYDKVNSEAKGDDKANLPSYSWFGIKTGVDLGVEYKHNEKFAFYTGAGLRLFQWGNMSGNPAKDVENGAWGFQGIQWDNGKWNGSTLGFGTVFTPSENLSIGAGLNTLIDRFVKIDLKAMNVSLGEFFEDTSSANAVDGLISRFDGIKFDITVSYKF